MKKQKLIIHPILFAIYPILSLLHRGLQIPLRVIAPSAWQLILPALIAVAFVVLIWLALFLLLRDWSKAAIVASLTALLVFLHGALYLYVLDWFPAAKSWHLLVFDVVVLALCGYLLHKSRMRMANLDLVANAIGLCLVLVPLVPIVIYAFSHGPAPAVRIPAARGSPSAGQPPDVYYLIVDGYARDDILRDVYGYDNSAFLGYLREKGFYVAEASQTNYCQTYLSLASSLNMAYLDDMGATTDASANPLRQPGTIGHSAVFEFFRQQGYQVAAFATGYDGTEIMDADIFLHAPWHLSEFQSVLLNMTPIPTTWIELQYDAHRRDIAYILTHLPTIPRDEAPIFAFAHIVVPHPPFIFGANGEAVQADRPYSLGDGSHFMLEGSVAEYQAGYRDQLIYVNRELMRTIDAILANSPEPPILILQSDHGPGSLLDWGCLEQTHMPERMSILNALYLPGAAPDTFYREMSPVNTFRLVLNHYFGTQLERLPDRSFYSSYITPYEFVQVLGR